MYELNDYILRLKLGLQQNSRPFLIIYTCQCASEEGVEASAQISFLELRVPHGGGVKSCETLGMVQFPIKPLD